MNPDPGKKALLGPKNVIPPLEGVGILSMDRGVFPELIDEGGLFESTMSIPLRDLKRKRLLLG